MDPYFGQVIVGAGVTAAFHPIAYGKILIQLGYEPLAPVQTTSIFGRKILCYPNIFKYIGHIKQKDGFLGLYRGLGARIVGSLVLNAVTNRTQHVLKDYAKLPVEDPILEGAVDNSTAHQFKQLAAQTAVETVSRCCGVIVSHPFQILMVRSMAQFVGDETAYDGVFAGFFEIPAKDGFLGYFSGLVPRLIGEVITIWLANILTFLADKYVAPMLPVIEGKDQRKTYTSAICSMIVAQLTYPFQLVSNIMAVTNCGLIAGEPPVMPIYGGWVACWKDLSSQKQLKRGATMFWRHYRGPTLTAAGMMKPAYN